MSDIFFIIMLFLVLALIIIFGSHFIFGFLCLRFFEINKKSNRLVFVASIISMAVIFIIFSILYRWKEHSLIGAIHIFSNLWIGLFINLFFASIAVWILLAIGTKLRLKINSKILAASFFLVAFIVFVWGVWNANNPRVVFLSAKIPNLPEHWKEKTIIHLSDVHLGHIRNVNFVQKVVGQVNVLDPDIILISGDLFDGMDGNLQAPLEALKAMRAKKGIYFAIGNHEIYLGVNKIANLLKETRINLLQNEIVDIEGLKIIGINYNRYEKKENAITVLKSMQNEFSGKPNILLYHSPVNIREFKKIGVNLQLSGHTHKGQIFPFNFITKLIYKGYDAGLHELGDYTLCTSVGVGTWGPPMRTGNRPEIIVIKLR